MFEREIGVSDVMDILETGDIIVRYDRDRPYPSRLVLGWSGGQPLHVVAADDLESDITVVITVYRPDPDMWTRDFRRRR
jgi:hypothetical protein